MSQDQTEKLQFLLGKSVQQQQQLQQLQQISTPLNQLDLLALQQRQPSSSQQEQQQIQVYHVQQQIQYKEQFDIFQSTLMRKKYCSNEPVRESEELAGAKQRNSIQSSMQTQSAVIPSLRPKHNTSFINQNSSQQPPRYGNNEQQVNLALYPVVNQKGRQNTNVDQTPVRTRKATSLHPTSDEPRIYNNQFKVQKI